MTPRRRHPTSPRVYASIISGDYDHADMLAELRATRADTTGDLHAATEKLAAHLAESLARDLPDIPAGSIGEVLLCAASKMTAMCIDDIPLPVALNVAAYAADDLLKNADQTKASST